MSLYVDRNVELERVFRSVQNVLTEAPALALPNLSEPFSLYISEERDCFRTPYSDLKSSSTPSRLPIKEPRSGSKSRASLFRNSSCLSFTFKGSLKIYF